MRGSHTCAQRRVALSSASRSGGARGPRDREPRAHSRTRLHMSSASTTSTVPVEQWCFENFGILSPNGCQLRRLPAAYALNRCSVLLALNASGSETADMRKRKLHISRAVRRPRKALRSAAASTSLRNLPCSFDGLRIAGGSCGP